MVSKYNNKRTNGYASRREAKCATELKLMEKAGHITALQEQVSFEIIPKCGKERAAKYIADFVWMENGKIVVADAKGARTREYVLKRKLMNWRFNIQIVEM